MNGSLLWSFLKSVFAPNKETLGAVLGIVQQSMPKIELLVDEVNTLEEGWKEPHPGGICRSD